ncbi:C-C motif chemokine 2-like [Myxocyprinus asiaticus]|uniref:C-C motif chemokine 2-like n=1 Tax=Myxocyprinus asiaticus TaxID=70543 RepID=UPI0022217D4F|nr:C-C motif chemokine 2-like [Myxocyprinus asiaticus]
MIKAMPILTISVFWVTLGAFSVFAEDGPPVSCCLSLGHTRPPLKRVLDYRNQTKPMCPIGAVVVWMVSGRTLCLDPNSDWTKKAILKVDEEKKSIVIKNKEQDPEKKATAEGKGERPPPVTATNLPLNSRLKRE